ncbi:hypothetical protein HG532_09370 [Moraxella osloensis]|nr:hypothetical protein [Moraxella osloensis]MBW4010227.1 hypothetical protein [Moraxella osloensis]
MENQNQVVAVQPKKRTYSQLSLKEKAIYAVPVAMTYALTATPAHAEGMFDSVYTTFQTEMESAKTNMIGMWGVAALVLIGFAIWRYTKRGANSA